MSSLDGPDAALDLGAEDGELDHGGVDHLPLQLRVVGERIGKQRGEHQQQRKQGQEAVVGQ